MNGPGFRFDTNVWIGLAFAAHPLHTAATAAFLATSPARPALFCRATQQSVLRLLTTAKVVQAFGVPALTSRAALAILDGFMASPSVPFLAEPRDLFARWRTFADLPSASPKRWMDAYLAAFAVEAGLGFVTADKDFAAFPGLDLTLLSLAASAPAPAPDPERGSTPPTTPT